MIRQQSLALNRQRRQATFVEPYFLHTEFIPDHKNLDHNLKRMESMFEMDHYVRKYRLGIGGQDDRNKHPIIKYNNEFLAKKRMMTSHERFLEDNKVQLDHLEKRRNSQSVVQRFAEIIDVDATMRDIMERHAEREMRERGLFPEDDGILELPNEGEEVATFGSAQKEDNTASVSR